MSIGAVVIFSLLIATDAAISRVTRSCCPPNAIAMEPGALIQATLDPACDGAAFCLKNEIHRAQAVRPRPKQRTERSRSIGRRPPPLRRASGILFHLSMSERVEDLELGTTDIFLEAIGIGHRHPAILGVPQNQGWRSEPV